MCSPSLCKVGPPLTVLAKFMAEFVGTFFFIQTICLTINTNTNSNAGTDQAFYFALSIGSVLMVIVYIWGAVSGGHFNPAVSTAALIVGKLNLAQWGYYLLAQYLGAMVAGAVSGAIAAPNNQFPIVDATHLENREGYWTEFAYTFLLVSAVLNTACSKSPAYEDNSFFGLAIGFSVTVGVYSAGFFSGGAFNPSIVAGVNVGRIVYTKRDDVTLTGTADVESWFVVMIMDYLGGIVAAVFFMFTEWTKIDGYENEETESEEDTTSYQPKKRPPTRGYEDAKPAPPRRPQPNYGFQVASNDARQNAYSSAL